MLLLGCAVYMCYRGFKIKCVCVCVKCTCQGAHVEVRGKLLGVYSLFHHVEHRDLPQEVRLSGKCLY